VTDKAGSYTLELPHGTYRIYLAWMGGECSKIRRASFHLNAEEHLQFDFFVLPCPIVDPIRTRMFEESAAKEFTQQGTEARNTSLANQTEKYQEQLVPQKPDRWPEIIISFGKYDNQGDSDSVLSAAPSRYQSTHDYRPTHSIEPASDRYC
jgi:hypothetical protein